MARGGSGTALKAVDKVLSKIPKVGPVVSALRPAENLMRLGPLIGAGAGAYATPVVGNYTRYDPLARDQKLERRSRQPREALKYVLIRTSTRTTTYKQSLVVERISLPQMRKRLRVACA